MDFKSLLRPGSRLHLIGIGGVSMSPLAEVLHQGGCAVTGSDMQESASVLRLRSLGIPVVIGHKAESVTGVDAVIRTAAVHDDNPEIVAAHAAGIPVFERAQAWGAIMREYEKALCISGTHGKTTTTSMCTYIALAAQADPTVMLGGTLPVLENGYRLGKKDAIILESCEYCNSFLSFFPTVAVVLNIEEDHLDFFKDLADIQRSFRKFAQLIPAGGVIVANCEDKNTMDALDGLDVLTFGLEKGDVHTENLVWQSGLPTFDVIHKDSLYAHVSLAVPGVHNVKNAVAACAASVAMGWSGEAAAEGLGQFHGAGRRFEKLGEVNGAQVYDDYAHHPGEITALLNSVKPLGYKRVVCAFQPHTFTRTKALFEEFVTALKLADLAVLTDIYPARETDDLGVSSAQLSERIPGSLYAPTLDDLAATLRSLAQPGDLILLVGAGNIVTVGKKLAE